ncbi:MAG: S8 family serine peptidase [Calditrichaeota bacterium]|nr:S8 family serine peptidase [Calditrichota bacterium]
MKRLLFLFVAIAVAASETTAIAERFLVQLSSDAVLDYDKTGLLPSSLAVANQSGMFVSHLFTNPNSEIRREEYLKLGMDRWLVFDVPDTTKVEVAKYLELSKDVEIWEKDAAMEPGLMPDDYNIYYQWHWDKVRTPAAWSQGTSDSAIIIGTIDTGCEITHPDLASNIYVNPGEDLNSNGLWDAFDNNGVDDDGNGYVDDLSGWDFFSFVWPWPPSGYEFIPGEDYFDADNLVYPDLDGHGTSVAGLAAAVVNNSTGVTCAARSVRLIPMKVSVVIENLSSGYMSIENTSLASYMSAGIQYAVDNGARIVSISWMVAQDVAALHTAVQYARSNNAIVFSCAGNSNNTTVYYPAGYDECVSITATGVDDVKASFASYGTTVDLCGPGTTLVTTSSTNSLLHQGALYDLFSGCSAATPIVSSVAALVLSHEPGLSDDELQARLLSTADNIYSQNPGYTGQLGAGRVNAYRAVGGTDPLGTCDRAGESCVVLPHSTCDSLSGAWTAGDSCEILEICVNDADGNLCWEKTFGGSGDDLGLSLYELPGGGFILAGYQTMSGLGRQGVVMRTDCSGDTIWTRQHGGTADDIFMCGVLIDSTRYLAAGTTRSNGAQDVDGWAILFNTDGDLIWERRFGGAGIDSIQEAALLQDGRIILTGVTTSSGFGGQDMWAVCFDQFGVQQFARTYGTSGADGGGRGVVATSDTGFVVSGYKYASSSNRDAWIIKCDQQGNVEWDRTQDQAASEAADAVALAANGDIYMLHWLLTGTQDIGLSLYTYDGILLWNMNYQEPGSQIAFRKMFVKESEVLICGRSSGTGSCNLDGMVKHVSLDGNDVATQLIGHHMDESFSGTTLTADGGMALLGRSNSIGAGGHDWYFVKVGGCEPLYTGVELVILADTCLVALHWTESVLQGSQCGATGLQYNVLAATSLDSTFALVATTADTFWIDPSAPGISDNRFYQVVPVATGALSSNASKNTTRHASPKSSSAASCIRSAELHSTHD